MFAIIRSAVNSSIKSLDANFDAFVKEVSAKLNVSEADLKSAIEESLPVLKDGSKTTKLSKEEIKKQKDEEKKKKQDEKDQAKKAKELDAELAKKKKQDEKDQAKKAKELEKELTKQKKELEKEETKQKKEFEKKQKALEKEKKKDEKSEKKSSKDDKKDEKDVKTPVEGFDFEEEPVVGFDVESEFWKIKTITIDGTKMKYHKTTGLILSVEDGNATLKGRLVDGDMVVMEDLSDEIKTWCNDCSIEF